MAASSSRHIEPLLATAAASTNAAAECPTLAFTAYDASAAVGASAECPVLAFTAFDAVAVVAAAALAECPTLVFVAFDATISLGPTAESPTLAFTAYDATALTGTLAAAECPVLVFVAYDATVTVGAGAGAPVLAFVAYDAGVSGAIPAGSPTLVFTAYDAVALAATVAAAGSPTLVFTAYNATVAGAPGVGSPTLVFTAYDVTALTVSVVLVYAKPTADELLDLDVRLRYESIRFDLLDAANALIGTLAVSRENVGSVDNDVTRPIHRTLGPLLVSASDLSGVNPFVHRVRPVWMLHPTDPAYWFNLGIFLFADASRLRRSFGTQLVGSLVDQRMILNQPLLTNVSYDVGKNIGDALTEQFEAAGIIDFQVDATTATLSQVNVWAAGRDTRLTVMSKLCEIVGYLPPYFTNNGRGICRAAPNLATAAADFTYGAGTRMLDGSVVESDDLLNAPNVYTATDVSPGGTFVGRFEVPASAPHSFANRGFWRPADPVEVQGFKDQAEADAAAQAAYVKEPHAFRWLAFNSTPDPRHDTHDVIGYDDGLAYLEQMWRLPLSEGAVMRHNTKAVFA